jgi:hypothetical protein
VNAWIISFNHEKVLWRSQIFYFFTIFRSIVDRATRSLSGEGLTIVPASADRLRFAKASASRGVGMSFQITILKVLAGHPGGRASLADVKRAMAILITSGSDWTDRTKRLAARAPDLVCSTGQCGLANH